MKKKTNFNHYMALVILGFGITSIIAFAVYDLKWESISEDDRIKWNNDKQSWENNKPLAILLVCGPVSLLWIIPLLKVISLLKNKKQK